MTVQDRRSVADRLNEAIRENPLAAGLIGAGVAWMLLGSKRVSAGLGAVAGAAKSTAATAATAAGTAAAGAGSAAASVGSRAADAARYAAGVAKDAAGAAGQTAAEAIDSAPSLVPEMPDTSKAADAAADMSAAVGDRVRQAAASGREYGAAIQSRLSENLERQPLLLGAIGLAIGAGVAASFATTAVEREWIGDSAAAARDKAGEAVADHARHVMSTVREEAERQNLTPEAMKETAATMAGKARNVAEAARDSAKETAGSRS